MDQSQNKPLVDSLSATGSSSQDLLPRQAGLSNQLDHHEREEVEIKLHDGLVVQYRSVVFLDVGENPALYAQSRRRYAIKEAKRLRKLDLELGLIPEAQKDASALTREEKRRRSNRLSYHMATYGDKAVQTCLRDLYVGYDVQRTSQEMKKLHLQNSVAQLRREVAGLKADVDLRNRLRDTLVSIPNPDIIGDLEAVQLGLQASYRTNVRGKHPETDDTGLWVTNDHDTDKQMFSPLITHMTSGKPATPYHTQLHGIPYPLPDFQRDGTIGKNKGSLEDVHFMFQQNHHAEVRELIPHQMPYSALNEEIPSEVSQRRYRGHCDEHYGGTERFRAHEYDQVSHSDTNPSIRKDINMCHFYGNPSLGFGSNYANQMLYDNNS